jgi:hypothetical protein
MGIILVNCIGYCNETILLVLFLVVSELSIDSHDDLLLQVSIRPPSCPHPFLATGSGV